MIAGTLALTSALRVSDTRPGTRGVDPAPTIDGRPLAGIWLLEGGAGEPATLFRFTPEGALAVDDTGWLGHAAVIGAYRVRGNAITFRAESESGTCAAGDTWAWDATIPEDGRLDAVVTEGGSGHCTVGVGRTRGTLVRVSPISAGGAAITFEGTQGLVGAPTGPKGLYGTWLRVGSGQLLSLGPDGRYAIDEAGALDTNPDDEGTWKVEAGVITFTSGAGSRGCHEGDRMVWEEVRLAGGGPTLRGVASEDQCSHGLGSDWMWLRISP